jgi:glyoxylase-like metal-dependent hydrolase (beta-lactamase superfamily II)
MMRRCLLTALLCWVGATQAFELQVEKVTDNVYALVGEIGPRSAENHALNNTLGFVVTPAGVVLIGSGATPTGARLIEKSIASVTSQPVRWVINIGAQDHHWLGNSYFAANGADIIALAKTVDEQHQHVDDHLSRLLQVVKAEAPAVKPMYATKPIAQDQARLNLGGEVFDLIWPGGGHFAGDAILWMPKRRVVFAGDYVFNERMFGVQPYSPVLAWQEAFHKIAALKPLFVIPGHGHPGDLSKAQRDTGDYLDWLVAEVGKAQGDWKDIGDTVNDLGAAPQFRHLKFYDSWHRKNINRTYLYLESNQ